MYAAIDTSKVRCLNESEFGACLHPFKPYSRRREAEPRLDSHDDDPELLLFVPFTRVVKLKSINIIGGHAGEGTAPTKIKLFMNRDDVDFVNCRELPAAQELELVANAASMGDGGGIDYPLKVSKFQNVDSLTIFFSENGGHDVTSVSYVGFKGEVTTARHGVVECVYESAPQAADHKQDAGESLMPDVSGN
eukprot:evm.model.NODE_10932_length_14799_cov_18.808027.4